MVRISCVPAVASGRAERPLTKVQAGVTTLKMQASSSRDCFCRLLESKFEIMKDKEKIRAEVERLMNELIQEKEKGFGSDIDDACILELQNVLTFIDSLQEEPVNEDLDKEIERYYADWDEKPRYIQTARHFANWQKQQIVKSAKLFGWIARDENGSLHIFEVEPSRIMHRWWDRDYHSTGLDENDFPDLKWEDEPVYIKLPIIKEE